MKLITFTRDTPVAEDSEPCRKGKPYVISDGFLQQIRENFPPEAIESIVQFQESPEKRYRGQPLDGKTLVLWRTGGMGDLIFITPCLRHIKETWPTAQVWFGCGPRFKYGMMNHPHVDKLLPLPIDFELVQRADYYLMFEGIIENNPRARQVNAYDLFAESFGFQGKMRDRLPVLGLSEDHVSAAEKMLAAVPGPKGPVVGVGLRASHIIRSIPPPVLDGIIGLLLQQGCAVALLGGKDDRDVVQQLQHRDHARVVHQYKGARDYRDTIAMVSLLDGVVGPDSSVVHMAGAFRKPVVGVYGPFPSALRMPYYVNASGFDVSLACGPCFLHGIETCEYSDVQSKEPMCMYVHRPDIIVNEMLALMKVKPGAVTWDSGKPRASLPQILG